MEPSPVLHLKCNPYPAYISSGRVVYGAEEKHPERIFSTFVAMFIEEGILYFTEGDFAYNLTPGQWFIQTPGIRHFGHQAGGIRTVFHFVHFLPQGEWHIETDALKRKQTPLPVRLLDSGKGIRIPQYELELPMRGTFLFSEWEELFSTLHQDRTPGREAIGKQLRFLELLEWMVWLDSEKETVAIPVKKVLDYIHQHYEEPLAISELAQHFHFSPDYLTRKIKQATGMTPSALIIRYRIDKAKQLLVQTNYSIQQIGHDIGYDDIAVFSRTFKKHTGKSPANYRNEQFGKGRQT